MKFIIKKIYRALPIFCKVILLHVYENFFRMGCFRIEKKESLKTSLYKKSYSDRKRILFYCITGLAYGGTEKDLQIIANDLVSLYDVYYMYSNKGVKDSREAFMDKRIHLIPFSYESIEGKYPSYIHEMRPHIKEVIKNESIDMIIVAEAGHTIYPIITITDIPIIMINVFGSPTVQKNIVHIVYMSDAVKKFAQFYTGNAIKSSVLNIPTTEVIPRDKTRNYRKELGIGEDAFVFGRIGRNSDNIFDPIGINAFKIVLKEFPDAHFIIVSPPPILEKIVYDESIPNVHFIPPITREVDVWAFHYAIDTLAHFRHDGETSGLNIAESMKVGNPIISHVSRIWNAHIEYLKPTFSRVANIDNVEEYASHMKEFINIRNNHEDLWLEMRKISQETGIRLFTKKTYMQSFRKIISCYI